MYIMYNPCKYIHYPPAILLLNRQIFYFIGRPGTVCLLFCARSRQNDETWHTDATKVCQVLYKKG